MGGKIDGRCDFSRGCRLDGGEVGIQPDNL
jgi:hypothetical protein